MRYLLLLLLSLITLSPLQVLAEVVARLDSIEGEVEYRRGSTEVYAKAGPGLELHAGDVIHTARNSRAGIIFASGTLLRIAPNTTLEVKGEALQQESIFLKAGKLFVFNRAEKELPIIRTPGVTASIRGTEVVIEAFEDGASVGVIEGLVQVSNDAGTLDLGPGEAARIVHGGAPVKEILVRSRELIEWALYYPVEIPLTSLESGFTSSQGKGALAAVKRGDYSAALRELAESSDEGVFGRALVSYLQGDTGAAAESLSSRPFDGLPEARVLRAALSLSLAGDLAAMQRDLDSIDATQVTPQLLATTESMQALSNLVAGDRNKAEDLSAAALARNGSAVDVALVRVSVLQASGRLSEAQEVLQGVTPSVGVHAKLAELALGEGDLDRGLSEATRAMELGPATSEALTVFGFVSLARGELDQATTAFDTIISSGTPAPRARFGLGLVKARRGDLEDARDLIAQAAALDPQVAIYRSYLGKAFFEDEQEQRALHEFGLAIERDANDPTPYLYRAYTYLALNQPIQALEDVESSIERNNNRVVYRSSLLLDRDEAVRSAGLGSVFSGLGFSNTARIAALGSLGKDYGNYAAHRLLADSYSESPFYLDDASRSEAAITKLLSPLSFNTLRVGSSTTPGSNDYNALFERSEHRRGIDFEYESVFDRIYSSAWGVGKGEQYGYLTSWKSDMTGGSKHGSWGRFHEGEVAAQWQPSWDTRFVFDGIGTYFSQYNTEGPEEFSLDRGEFEGAVVHTFSPKLRGFVDVRHGNPRQDFITNQLPRNVAITSVAQGEVIDEDVEVAPFDERTRERVSQTKSTAQLIYDSKAASIVFGSTYLSSKVDREESSIIPGGVLDIPSDKDLYIDSNSHDALAGYDLYLYPIVHLADSLDLTLGANFTEIDISDTDIAPFVDGTSRVSHVSPKLGLRWEAWRGGAFRAAFYENLRKTSREDQITLEPTQIGGINQIFTSQPGTLERTWGVGFDQKFPTDTYIGVEGAQRHLSSPLVSYDTSLEINYDSARIIRGIAGPQDLDIHSDVTNVRGYTYQVLSKQWVATMDHDLFRFSDYSDEDSAREELYRSALAVRHFDPSGWFSSVNGTFRNQRINFGAANGDEVSSFWLLNATTGYRLRNRRGRIALNVVNILDKDFTYDTSYGLEPFIAPGIGVWLTASYNF
jgi:tetratricopeptide (TPR) repeat protein